MSVAVMAGFGPIGAKIRHWLNAIRVMPGLLPGIYAVRRRVAIRTSTRFSAPDALQT
jgi:hypothetical protein